MATRRIRIRFTEREARLLFGLIKLSFEMQTEGKFPMSNETLMELIKPWEELAAKIDALDGIRSSSIDLPERFILS